uniref:Heat shock 70 kDa protein 14 n=1 Tax=Cacopsylla melanoneura TaxID=428564 RepID=A0A8D8VZV7_9HEMI
MSKTVFGLYLGNSSASIGICRDGKVDILANEAGDRVTPAVVTFSDTEEVVGAAAKSRLISQAKNTIIKNKRALNTELTETDLETIMRETKVDIDTSNDTIQYRVSYQDSSKVKTIDPIQVTTVLLKTIYGIAKSAIHTEEDTISCVLLTPVYFNHDSRKNLRKAAQDAGWNILHVINEPCAALLGYNINTAAPEHNVKVLVYRCGGISCDVTIVDIQHGLMSIVDSVHSTEIGGEKIVKKLMGHLQEEIQRKYKLDIADSHRSMAKLRAAAETCMHVLSALQSSDIFIESLYDGLDFKYNVSRGRFDSLIGGLLGSFVQPIEDLLARANVKNDQINKVLLVGGPLKIPKFQSYIKSLFPLAECPGTTSINPDEILAAGAARQAGFLVDMLVDFDKHLPEPNTDVIVIGDDISVEVVDMQVDQLKFSSNLPLPCVQKLSLGTLDSTSLHIVASQSSATAGVMLKGKVAFENLTSGLVVTLSVHVTIDNKLNVELWDNSTPSHLIQSHALELVEVSA